MDQSVPRRRGRPVLPAAIGVILFLLSGWVTVGATTRGGEAGHGRSERLSFLRGTIDTTPCGLLFTMNPDGSDQRRFIGIRLPVCFVSWSPDGKRLAFNFAVSGKSGIYAIDADGHQLRHLTTSSTDLYPSWSPNGRLLVFVRRFNLYEMNADGGGLKALTHITAAQGVVPTEPRWSPDGTRIAFQLQANPPRVAVLDLADHKVTAVGTGGSPSWSSDGKRIAFDRNGRLEAINADGTKPRILVQGDGPAWSPDGGRIAFWRRTTGIRAAVYITNSDGSRTHRITQGPYDTAPAWLPG